MQISWEVRNRFRLFREERDFLLHTDSARGRSILASEQALELQSDGRGWARNTVNRLCIDLTGRVNEPCTRDNVKESYLAPSEHPITVRLTGAVPVGATCAWSFDDGDTPRLSTFDCAEPVDLRARYGRTTVATVEVSSGPRRRSVSPPKSRCAIFSSPASATASHRAKAIRTVRSHCRTTAFAFAPISGCRTRNIIVRAAPVIKAGGPARPGLAADVATPERALAQFGLPPLAVQLPDPHRAGARRAISAYRGDLSAAGMHRRHHRRRPARRPARARMPADEIRRGLPGFRQRPGGGTARRGRCGKTPAARPQAGFGAAVDRRQRHQLFRAGRRRHHG